MHLKEHGWAGHASTFGRHRLSLKLVVDVRNNTFKMRVNSRDFYRIFCQLYFFFRLSMVLFSIDAVFSSFRGVGSDSIPGRAGRPLASHEKAPGMPHGL
jgi:hypothetical protein